MKLVDAEVRASAPGPAEGAAPTEGAGPAADGGPEAASPRRFIVLEPACPAEVLRDGQPVVPATATAMHPDGVRLQLDAATPTGLDPETAHPVRLVLRAGEGGFATEATLLPRAPGAPELEARFGARSPETAAAIETFITRHRKADHIRICRDRDVASEGVTTGFERIRLPHEALPELHKAEVDLTAKLFGRTLGAPILISCMTGGSELAKAVNQRLARTAQRYRLALGLGSQRALLKAPELIDTYAVRDLAPDVLLFGNVGAVQLNYGMTAKDCARLREMVQADVLCLHLNPLQEAVQPEGDVDFRGLKEKIARLAGGSGYPIVLKEVGNGIGPQLCRWVAGTALAGVDVAGAGGTSWSKVESYRAQDPNGQAVARAFSGWGWPTADAVQAARTALPGRPVIASGGVRDGIDCAKAIALGASLVGLARPFLEAAARSQAEVDALAARLVEELRVAMFCAGAQDIRALRSLEWVRV